MSQAHIAPTGFSTWLAVTKPRLALLSSMTGVVGYLAAPELLELVLLLPLVSGIFLAAAGSLALNQWMERTTDALMERTCDRPLPQGQLQPNRVAVFGIMASLTGVAIIAAMFNLLAAALTAITILSYLLLYTPLKRKTALCTHVGALPGALPPLIGWSAATGDVSGLGWVLFLILLFWQMPHFFAIAWHCREDYARGGLRVLSVTHPDGTRLLAETWIFTVLLIIVSFLPIAFGVSLLYPVTASILNLWFLWETWRFHKTIRDGAGTNYLFAASLIYLPLLLLALLIDLP